MSTSFNFTERTEGFVYIKYNPEARGISYKGIWRVEGLINFFYQFSLTDLYT